MLCPKPSTPHKKDPTKTKNAIGFEVKRKRDAKE